MAAKKNPSPGLLKHRSRAKLLVSLTKAGCCKGILLVKEPSFVAANVLGLPFQEISDYKGILNQSVIYREVI